jgi:hypothetical protein
MVRITTAVDRRLGYGHEEFGYSNNSPEFVAKIRGLSGRLDAFRQKALKKAIQIELDELNFWLSELNRPKLEFSTAVKLAQRIRSIQNGLPTECQMADLESRLSDMIRRSAIARAKAMLASLKKLATSDWYRYGTQRDQFIRFKREQVLSFEDLDFSKIRLHHLNMEAEKTYKVMRETKRRNKPRSK